MGSLASWASGPFEPSNEVRKIHLMLAELLADGRSRAMLANTRKPRNREGSEASVEEPTRSVSKVGCAGRI